jgi:hypothetical protein
MQQSSVCDIKDVEQVGLDAYTDIWREWEGITALQEATG